MRFYKSTVVLISMLYTTSYSAEIAFIHPDEWIPNQWTFQNLRPNGPDKCNNVVNTWEDRISSIRLRTGYTDADSSPDAIAFYHGKECSRSTIKFIIFYYNSPLVDQVFYLGELPEEDMGMFTKYKELEEGAWDWNMLVGGISRRHMPLREGDVLYKQGPGQGWKNLTNVVEVSSIPTKKDPKPELYDWYGKGVGLRQSNSIIQRVGTLDPKYPDSPDSVQIRPSVDGRLPIRAPMALSQLRGSDSNPLVPTWPNRPAIWREEPPSAGSEFADTSPPVDESTSLQGILGEPMARRPMPLPRGHMGSGRLQVPNPSIPRVFNPSSFSVARQSSPNSDDELFVLRPQQNRPFVNLESPNTLGEVLRESAEEDDSVTDVPDELAPGERVGLQRNTIDPSSEFQPILGSLQSQPKSEEYNVFGDDPERVDAGIWDSETEYLSFEKT
ncbi:hypothetical protein H072_2218 [Dactylellina haptotyla CBS 200.50]|uniref:Uncharacterized protein n=1 Tax=Dactylellina haptotyla (strain CBS 200.50) TaxID=1284197 RepID=S8ALG5_DACHA|nr:hypothetical protein H072_2218 [Dactylellina haptotyla CBS 200.50]